MTPNEIETLFTRSDGTYCCARWGRPIAPIVFGVDDATLSVVKGAIEATCAMSGHTMAETDPELGSNFMFFFFRNWEELLEVPDLDRIVPELADLVTKLKSKDANQYRIFRFDPEGGIKACFVFIRMDAELSKVPAETLALLQVVQSFVLWSDTAFLDQSPMGRLPNGSVVLKPEIANLIRAIYAPELPVCDQDPSHALRLFARVSQMEQN